MKKIVLIFPFLLLSVICFAQENALIGIWNFTDITTTDSECKSVSKDDFPISQFIFLKNGKTEMVGEGAKIKGSYEFKDKRIRFYNCTENGQELKGEQFMNVSSVSNNQLVININYECGTISMVFDKKHK